MGPRNLSCLTKFRVCCDLEKQAKTLIRSSNSWHGGTPGAETQQKNTFFLKTAILQKALNYQSKTSIFSLYCPILFNLFMRSLFLFSFPVFCCFCSPDDSRVCPASRNLHYSKEGLTKIEDARVPGGSPRGRQSMPKDPKNGTSTKKHKKHDFQKNHVLRSGGPRDMKNMTFT